MNWIDSSKFSALSACRRYELAGRYINGYFAWRGRVIQTDELVASSQDRGFVERACERHAERLDAQVAAAAQRWDVRSVPLMPKAVKEPANKIGAEEIGVLPLSQGDLLGEMRQ